MKGGGLAQTLQVQAVQLPLHSVNIHTAAKPRGRGDSALGEGPGGGMVASAAFVLFEGASGYALFEVTALDELALGAAPVQQAVQDLARFSKVGSGPPPPHLPRDARGRGAGG